MGLQAVEEQAPVSEREALAPATDGLRRTLALLPVDDPAYAHVRAQYHHLVEGNSVAQAPASDEPRPIGPLSYAQAVQPALDGLQQTLRLLDESHWARLSTKCVYHHLWWNAQRPDAQRAGKRPSRTGPPA